MLHGMRCAYFLRNRSSRRLCGQTVTVCGAVPRYVVFAYRINGCQILGGAPCIAKANSVQPRNVFDRQLVTRKITRIFARYLPILRLRQFVNAHIEIAYSYGVLRFVIGASSLSIGASHFKSAAIDKYKVFGRGFIICRIICGGG